MKKICLFILFGLHTSLQLIGQTNDGHNVSNDPFSATAGVNIPLVTKKIDGIDLGVGLSYSTKGIKLNEISSEVGLGWNLNCGGGIYRTIKGLPDELYYNHNGFPQKVFKGYWQRTNSSLFTDINAAVNEIHCNQTIDSEMDEFTINIPGLNLTFYINNNNEIITKPNNTSVRIKRIINNQVVTFPMTSNGDVTEIGFEITDEGGNVFRLESGEQSEVILNGGWTILNFTNRWVIKQIETYNGKKVDYFYQTPTDFIYESDVIEEALDNANYCFLDDYTYQVVKQRNWVKYIDRIEFPDIKILFIYDNANLRQDVSGAKCLKQLHIVEKDNIASWQSSNLTNVNTIKKIQFEHSYFSVHGKQPYPTPNVAAGTIYGESNLDSEDFRLCLDKIQQIAGVPINQVVRNLYEFSYFDVSYPGHAGDIPIDMTIGNELALPYRLNPCQDYWGYFNGELTDGTGATPSGYLPSLIPKPINSATLNGYGVDRTPNNKNRLFSLKKIVNEGKGVTELSYGMNEVSNGTSTILVDGLRLDRVSSYTLGMESNTTTHITDYIYENGDWLMPTTGSPSLIDLFKKTIDLECTLHTGYDVTTTPQSNIVSYSNHMQAISGPSQHGYGKVTALEKKQYAEKVNGLGQSVFETVGKTETYYTTMKTFPTQFTIQGNVYGATPNNLLLPTLTPVTSYSIATSDYRKMYNQQPLSNKQHYIDWMVGVPYKTYKYDKFQNLLVATEQEYTVYVNQINNDNALNLNISPSLFGKTKPQNSTEWIPKQYCTSDKFNFDFYHLLTGRMELKSNSVKTYQDNVHYLEKKIEYEYDPSNGYPRKTIETLPNNVVVEERQFYSSDNNNWNNNTAMVSLTNANKTRVIHSETWRQEPGQTMKLLDASGGGYIEVQGKVHSNINYHLKGSTLLTTSPIVTNVFSQADADQGITIPGFEKGSIYTKYDVLGNPCEVSYKGKNNASIYDYYQDALLATVSNSTYNEMAYSSFESNIYKTDYNAADFEYDKGNWRFFTQGLKRNFGITGKNCYDLNATYDETIGNVFTTKPVEIHSASNVELVIGKKYIISFWRKQTANVSILNYDTSPASSTPVTYTTYMTNVSTLQAINGWTFCQAEFTAQHKRIKISGDALIDELRLYPADASMLTSCFTPIYGKMSECDAGNNIQHFEYDEVERVHITRDGKGNIRSKSKTAKQLQD